MRGERIDAVILCGGLGSRLRAATGEHQKTMAKVSDRPFLDIVVDHAASFGVKRFILCTGFRSNEVTSYYATKADGLEIVFSTEEIPLGTAGALKNAQRWIRSEHFFLMNGDSFCSIDLKGLLNFHKSKDAVVTLSAVPPRSREDGGYLEVNRDCQVEQFGEKDYKPSRYLNAGITVMKSSALGLIDDIRPRSFEKDFLPSLLMRKNVNVYAYLSSERLYDIGTPQRLAAVRNAFCPKEV